SDKSTAQMGDTVTLTATPDAGYELSGYTVTKETGGVVEVINGEFIMPADNVTVSATFGKITYNVVISDGILNGTVNSDKAQAQINDVVTLTAVPETGYELSSYTVTKENGGNVEVTDSKFTMPADNVTVSASFSKKTYNVFISPDVVNATVTATPATAQIGDLITLTVEMHPGHIFTGHVVTNESGGDVPVSESTFIMPGENVTASITFTKIDYTIAISDAIINGTVTADKTSGQVNDLITLTAVPETGYQLTGYTVTTDTGGSIPVVNSRFPMPADNVTISAAFSKIQPKPSGGGGTDTGSGHYTKYPRNVRDGGYVSFGTSPIVTGVDLPKGTTGEVLLITVTNAAAPVGFDVYAIVEIEAPSIGQPATIYFTLNTDQIKAAGYTTKDIVLYHCKDGKWVPLTTKLIAVDGKNAKYSAETDSFSPFAIVYDEGKTIVSTVEPTVVPTTSPTEVPTVTETLPPVQTTTAQAKTPVPLAGLVLGLGAAVFLTRWMRH
ncbi:MAG: PGF-pre-PGF domain-containing protein, partial [Methanocorpusculum sp.]|nr:PGF-pre-PGF domain-containing protein [Methanocorpusculum sp.]